MNKANQIRLQRYQLVASARKSAPQRIKRSNLGKTLVNVIYVDFTTKKVLNG